MKSCGIICEYNPFHSGHSYHLSKAKEITQAEVMIGVMTHHFVQRGEVACVSAKERAHEALTHGMNLIVELPYPYCLEGADNYAIGAIKILTALQCDALCFGSESNSLALLQENAYKQENQSYDPSKSYLSQSNLETSNDILGTAYLKAIHGTAIVPYPIQRTNSYQEEALNLAKEHASASSLRKAYLNKEDISKYTNLQEYIQLYPLSQFYPYLRTLLGTLPKEYLSSIFLMSEGIENLLIKNAREYDTYEEFLNHCITKKYTRARIQRTLWHLLLQTTKKEAQKLKETSFVRILATDEVGMQYLKEIKKNHEINLISKFSMLPEEYKSYIQRVHSLLYVNQAFNWEEELHYPYLY